MESLYSFIPPELIGYVTLAVTICGLITTVLPAPKADSGVAYRSIYLVIQWIALNLGKAKNAQDQKTFTFQSRPTYPDDGKR